MSVRRGGDRHSSGADTDRRSQPELPLDSAPRACIRALRGHLTLRIGLDARLVMETRRRGLL